jgi:hypothetical protein
LSQCVTSASSEANARTSVPAAMGKTGIFALMSVSIRFAACDVTFGSNRAPQPPETSGPTHIAAHGLISETNVFNLTDQYL